MKTIFLAGLLISFSAYADKHEHKHGHKSLSAHEHGTCELAMAFEGKKVSIELSGPSESFLGFEHAPKSKEEKLAMDRALALWNVELPTKLIMFDNKLGCTKESSSFEQTAHEGEHSEVMAKAVYNCTGSFAGTDVKIGIKDKFPKVKKLKLEVIAEKTKTIDIKKAIETVRL